MTALADPARGDGRPGGPGAVRPGPAPGGRCAPRRGSARGGVGPDTDHRPRSRWPSPLAWLGLFLCLEVAWVVLVTARVGTGPVDDATAVERAVTDTLLADRVASVLQWVVNVAATFLIGGFAFRLLVRRPVAIAAAAGGALRIPWVGSGPPRHGRSDRQPPPRLAVAAGLVGALASAASVLPRAAAVSGQGWAAAADPDALLFVVETRFGEAALLRLAGFALLVGAALSVRRWRGPVLAGAGCVLLLGAYALTGHPRATEPAAVLVAVQAAHVLAVSAWFGGVVCLALELRRLRRRDRVTCPEARETGRVVARFSRLAMVTVAVAAVTGCVLAASQLDAVGDLVSTSYGRALAGKLGFLALALALGGYNAVLLVPAIAERDDVGAWDHLVWTLSAEAVLLALGVLLLTTVMVTGGI